MSKNAEELYEQKQYKIRAREEREMKVAELEEQLNYTRNTNDHLNSELDRKVKELDRVNGILNQVNTVINKVKLGDISTKMFKCNVLTIMGRHK